MSTYYVPALGQATGGQKIQPQLRKDMKMAQLPYILARTTTEVRTKVLLERGTGN